MHPDDPQPLAHEVLPLRLEGSGLAVLLVLRFLAQRAGPGQPLITSINEIGQHAGIGRGSTQRAVHVLEREGLIVVQRPSGHPMTIEITDPAAG